MQITNKETQESFYKIGVTSRDVSKRYSQVRFYIKPIFTLELDIEEAYTLEKSLHSQLANYSYLPIDLPNGITECYKTEHHLFISRFFIETVYV